MFFDEVPIDLSTMLTSEFGAPESKDGKSTVWHTPYGCSFMDCGMGPIWFFVYDEDLEGIAPRGDGKEHMGAISKADIVSAVEQLKKEPGKLKAKPASITHLEKLTGKVAMRHPMFGKWHIYSPGQWSAINNPFHLSLGYTDSSDDFEI